MKEELEQRLTELRSEFANGQKMLADMVAKQADVRTTMLRISGAIQVLEELLGSEGKESLSQPETQSTATE